MPDEASPIAPSAPDSLWQVVVELQQVNALLEAQLRNTASGILMVDRAGKVVSYNRRFLELWHIQEDSACDKSDNQLLDEVRAQVVDWESFIELVMHLYAHPEEKREGDVIELRSGRILSRNTRPVRLADGTIIGRAWDFVDVTDLKRSEKERGALAARVQHAQKLESLGVLAGGIAHDFNNLLVGILGNAELALETLPRREPARNFLEGIATTARRAAELANQLLAYAGKGRFVVSTFDLNALIEELSSLLEASISKKACLRFDLAGEAPSLEADATQIRQVVMNLITNASDAIGDGEGAISIRTGVMAVDRAYLSKTFLDEELPEGRYVFFEVDDSGRGMDAETKRRMFDPFFSTKAVGRGLGMAALLGIVRGHQGAIRVSTQPGAGTTIRVLFPASGREAPPVASEPGTTWRCSGKVLVVDDEPVVREVAEAILSGAGFEVLTARDGVEALEVVRRQGDELVAVLLDLAMPHLDGAETARELRRMCPGIKILLCSGYSELAVDQLVASGEVSGFLHKPYRPSALIDELRKLGEDRGSMGRQRPKM